MALPETEIIAPTLFVDLDRVKQNIAMMKQKADKTGTLLQPHFKTHQSLQIGNLFKEQGIDRATVSSLKMAQYFAHGGWEKLHLAMLPINTQKQQMKSISKGCSLSVNISSPEHIKALEGTGISGAFIDIDTGYGRTGVDYLDHTLINTLIDSLQNYKIAFKGFYSHNGLTYYSKTPNEIKTQHETSVQKLLFVKENVAPDKIVMLGDTPGCSVCQGFADIDIVSAGNYVFYDFMQYSIGSCSLDDIAVFMACPVLEKRESESLLVVHGGAVHFSKEYIDFKGIRTFGQLAILKNDKRLLLIDGHLSGISQEHGMLKVSPEVLNNFNVGDSVIILPIHSCLTADCMGAYLSTTGEPMAMM